MEEKEKRKLTIVIPCYNEEEIIEHCIKQLLQLLKNLIDKDLISNASSLCFVNDGSSDATKKIIKEYCKKNKKISLISLSKNFGQQAAIRAAIENIEADIVITLDADLQDDISVVETMIKEYYKGNEIVYGCRKNRKYDTYLQKISSFLFYKLANLLKVKIRYNHAEFRLLSKKAIEFLKEYKEKTMFLRGVIQNIGLKSCDVFYDRQKRIAGKSKYNFIKLTKYALKAITNSSCHPLKLISLIGFVLILLAFILIFCNKMPYVQNILSKNLSILLGFTTLYNGIILISLGLIAEYISKILIEVKAQPIFQIEQMINIEKY